LFSFDSSPFSITPHFFTILLFIFYLLYFLSLEADTGNLDIYIAKSALRIAFLFTAMYLVHRNCKVIEALSPVEQFLILTEQK
jgi:hypothetical protein